MNDDGKLRARTHWIKEPGALKRVVTQASADEVAEAWVDPANVPTRVVDTSSDTNIPPDWQGPQNAVFPDDDVYVLKRRKEEMVFDDATLPRLAPMVAEGVIWRLYQMRCWEPGSQDKADFEADVWPFHVACAWIAAQSNEGALDNIAAHRWWKGRTIRDGRRSGHAMSFKEAIEALRLGLEAGLIKARRSRLPGAEVIPEEIWSNPDWEPSEFGELLEFEKLRCDGKVRYRRPVLPRREVLGLAWTVDGPVDSETQRMTIAKEVQCEKELVDLMIATNPIPKKEVKEKYFPALPDRAFDRAWSNAVKMSGQSAWGKAGRRKGPPNPNQRT